MIPRASTDALFKSFRAGVAAFKVVARTGHNTISESQGYLPLLKGASFAKPVQLHPARKNC